MQLRLSLTTHFNASNAGDMAIPLRGADRLLDAAYAETSMTRNRVSCKMNDAFFAKVLTLFIIQTAG